MQIAVLGPLEVRDATGVRLISGTRLRTLLVRLVIAVPQPVPAAALVDAVWGESPPADPVNALQSLISRLRRVLGDTDVVAQLPGGRYQLKVAEGDLDLCRFHLLVKAGREQMRAKDYEPAAASLREALQLWRGPALDGAADDAGAADGHSEVAGLAARLQEQRQDALADRIECELALGARAELLGELEQLVAVNPLRERFTLLLMRALYGAGQLPQALATYDRTGRLLADALGIDPSPELQAAHVAMLRGEQVEAGAVQIQPVQTQPEPVHRSNLRAQLTSFVGREDDVARIGKLLREGRLVTLVGPGGAGKTRLATEAVASFLDSVPDGVWLAELAPVSDPADVPQTVLACLGLRNSTLIDRSTTTGARDAISRLVEAVADREAILVLDNCEHLIDAAAQLADELLAHCPQLRVLTTSREPLGVYGEVLFAVPPLGQPAPEDVPELALAYPATRLFADRAAAVRPSFVIDDSTVAAVIEIVRRLDGLPLAIELAAARLRTLSVEQIAARLHDRFRLLTGGSRTALPRHRTLLAVVEWSWDLLTEDERRLARRLAVFVGGITVASATAVCLGDDLPADAVEDLLGSLVDKSLLQLIAAQGRYRMLETLREFGIERMAAEGEVGDIRTAHAAHFRAVVAQADPLLRTREQLGWMAVLEAERDNIVAALRYLADDGQAQPALEVAIAMSWYWVLVGRHTEAATWTAFALNSAGELDLHHRLVGQALVAVNAGASTWAGSADEMQSQMDDLRALNSELDVVNIPAASHPMVAVLRPVIAMFVDDMERSELLIEEGLRNPDPWTAAAVRAFRAGTAENRGDMDAMRVDAEQALAEFSELGERWGIGNCLSMLAPYSSATGELELSVTQYRESLRLFGELGAQEDESLIRLRLAEVLSRQGKADEARAEVDIAVRRTESRRDVEAHFGSNAESIFGQILMADIERMSGDLDRARELRDEALVRLSRIPEPHPIRGHVHAITFALAAKIDVADADVIAAHLRLQTAYRVGVATKDLPIAAAVGVAVAMLAEQIDALSDALEILGAAARLRGTEDGTQFDIARLRSLADERLGTPTASAIYDRGRRLDKDQAIARLDPGLLRLPLPTP